MTNFNDLDEPRDDDGPKYSPSLLPEALPMAVAEAARSAGWQSALELVHAHWDRFAPGHPEALLAAIRALPGEAFVDVPSLLVAVNYLQHLISGAEPDRFYDVDHDDGRRDEQKDLLDRLISSAGRTAGHRTSGRVQEAVRTAEAGRRILEGMSSTEKAQYQMALPHLLVQWGRSFELADLGGVREYEDAWELAHLTNQPLIARRAAASLAWLHADHGRLNDASTWVTRGHEITTAGPRYDAPLHLAAAMIAADRLDRDSIDVHLARLESVPIGEYWAAETWVRGWAAETEHDVVRIENLLSGHRMSKPQSLQNSASYARYLALSQARLSTFRDRNPRAAALDSDPSAFHHIMSAAYAYRTGSMHDALQNAERGVLGDERPRAQSVGLLICAAARLGLGRSEAAAAAFTTAHAVIEMEGLYSSYAIIAPAHLIELSTLTGLPMTVNLASSDLTATSGVALASLSRRERQVLIHLASDESLQAIAESLFISKNTVKTTTSALYRKLGVNSRQAAVDLAQKAGIV